MLAYSVGFLPSSPHWELMEQRSQLPHYAQTKILAVVQLRCRNDKSADEPKRCDQTTLHDLTHAAPANVAIVGVFFGPSSAWTVSPEPRAGAAVGVHVCERGDECFREKAPSGRGSSHRSAGAHIAQISHAGTQPAVR